MAEHKVRFMIFLKILNIPLLILQILRIPVQISQSRNLPSLLIDNNNLMDLILVTLEIVQSLHIFLIHIVIEHAFDALALGFGQPWIRAMLHL